MHTVKCMQFATQSRPVKPKPYPIDTTMAVLFWYVACMPHIPRFFPAYLATRAAAAVGMYCSAFPFLACRLVSDHNVLLGFLYIPQYTCVVAALMVLHYEYIFVFDEGVTPNAGDSHS